MKERNEKRKMATYHDLEGTVYKWVHDQPFTRILGKPTWTQVEKVRQDLCGLALEVEVSYEWAGEYGLLGVIMGAVKYHSETGLNMRDPPRYTTGMQELPRRLTHTTHVCSRQKMTYSFNRSR